MGLAAALNTGKTSLFTNQKAIEITGVNIANVNTEGYSRQTAVFSDYPALNFGDYFIGTGVKVSDVQREYDAFISEQLLDKSQQLGAEDAKEAPLAELERIFSVGEENLATEIDRFFDAWQELSANPSGQVERDLVIQRGELLASEFNTISNDLDNVAANINTTVLSELDAVNLKLTEIADLNQRIQTIEAKGQTANSFRDQRDQLLQELTYALGVQSFEEPSGAVNVQLPGGLPLVQNSSALQLEAVQSGDSLELQLVIGGSSFDVSGRNLGGKFSGLFELRDEFIPSLKQDLDYTAYQMIQEVNALHESGMGLDGSTGIPFFQNPGNHMSQAYADNTVAGFVGGNVSLVVDGVDYSFSLAAGTYSLDDVRDQINAQGAPLTAETAQDESGNWHLMITPDYDLTRNSPLSVSVDLSELAGSYDAPEFSMSSSAALMSVAVRDTSKVAAGDSSAPGDNTNALEVAALKDKNAVNGEDTFVSFYGKMAARVGVEASQSELARRGSGDALDQLKTMRDGVAGVSLEEEMIALIKYQRGFEASAKLLSTVDEMMSTVLGIIQ
ncbi:MAG: flagellar hook-associated protein FlgK [Desulfuromonadaceae bacterium]|nr:flagellar hook-associated protein FlgK [Desulfuromonadaceae bacterium]